MNMCSRSSAGIIRPSTILLTLALVVSGPPWQRMQRPLWRKTSMPNCSWAVRASRCPSRKRSTRESLETSVAMYSWRARPQISEKLDSMSWNWLAEAEVLLRADAATVPEGRKVTLLSGLICAIQVESRSEEHTSELQSLAYLVCRLLLEKKKKQ